jgi:hypothetical protein
VQNSPRLSTLSVLAIAAGLVACGARPVTIPIPNSGGQLQGNPPVLHVIRLDSTAVTVYVPVIARDSLIGWLDAPSPDQPPTSRIAISLADVRQINSAKMERSTMGSLGGAAAMVVLGVGVLLGLLLIAYYSSSEIGR